jgi:hypothetical protein
MKKYFRARVNGKNFIAKTEPENFGGTEYEPIFFGNYNEALIDLAKELFYNNNTNQLMTEGNFIKVMGELRLDASSY